MKSEPASPPPDESLPLAPDFFSQIPHQPLEHFKLYFYAAILRLLAFVAGSAEFPAERGFEQQVFEQFPLLFSYNNELAQYGLGGMNLPQAEASWAHWLKEWENASPERLPLSVLQVEAGLTYETLLLLFLIGLVEEDARFASLYQALQSTLPGEKSRPTAATLSAMSSPDSSSPGGARRDLNRLREMGFIEVIDPAAPRLDWVYQPNPLLWDALHGWKAIQELPVEFTGWCRLLPASLAPSLANLCLPASLGQTFARLPALVASGDIKTIVLRGPQNNDRRALLQCLAAQNSQGILWIEGFATHAEERWRMAGSLALITGCMPVVAFDLSPGEQAELPELIGYQGPLGLAVSSQGGLVGPRSERLLALNLDLPDLPARQALWQACLSGVNCAPGVAVEAARLRLARGAIRRVASLASASAALEGREQIVPVDIQNSIRMLNRQTLDALAHRLDHEGSLDQLAVNETTGAELNSLLSRIRHREQLGDHVGPSLKAEINPGVRALFSGPSGTGKTLAARLLAAELNLDIYRIDLSSVVNKYIGETEKNLNRVFSRAEELDVILLLDEGDSLLTQRTAVGNSNDRYANLETNYLLQRVETFQGVIIITTNASERIDQAFQRRMDVVIEFQMPDPTERWAIWQSHLADSHQVSSVFFNEVVARCALSGAQIRNAVLHASLLALQAGGEINDACLYQALQREYRKAGAICPIKFQEAKPSLQLAEGRLAQAKPLPLKGND